MSRRPGIRGTSGRAAVSSVMRMMIPRSAFDELRPRKPVELVKGGTWYHESVRVLVHLNVVTLVGEVDRKTDVDILTRMTREVDGVVDVVNRLRYSWDDTSPSPAGGTKRL